MGTGKSRFDLTRCNYAGVTADCISLGLSWELEQQGETTYNWFLTVCSNHTSAHEWRLGYSRHQQYSSSRDTLEANSYLAKINDEWKSL